MNREVHKLLVEQVNKEFYSAYLYLDMFSFYSGKTLNGFANWFHVQAQEERDHAMLFVQYLINNGEEVTFEAIAKPEYTYQAFGDPLNRSLAHEKLVTASIHNIYDKAYADRDYRTMQFLDWFVKEQGEEEKNADELIRKYELFGDDPKSLYLMDGELATRVYAPPSLVL